MYTPELFAERNEEAAFRLIDRSPFATLIAAATGGPPEIVHVPCFLDRGARQLWLHVARANSFWERVNETEVTAIFHGPHGYVSPRWYEQPRQQVPTWNYAVVHVHGRASIHLGRPTLEWILEELSRRFEPDPEGWRTSWMDETLRAQLLGAIVGIDVRLERVEAKVKLSQNRSVSDRLRVAEGLEKRGSEDDLWMSNEIRARARRT
ncbi:MAG: FMN-binding negative transcriptional regulator [Deltaproteobacteria bacterium]|nr:FMN-binding negative transcriptional regulator [Deltaproteobacteria bacterium]